MSGKGSGRRPGEGYEDAWERIFGRKPKEQPEPKQEEQKESDSDLREVQD